MSRPLPALSPQGERVLVITADDFGASLSVNNAVERAHRHGVLTAASLMVTGEAAADAVARARAMPGLGVGLHLVLVEGKPALPPDEVPDLVGPDGRFRPDMVRPAFAMAFRKHVRRQLFAEVEAQFAAFAASGLPLDHVNAHKHFHLHPVIAAAIIAAGRKHGMKAVRAPVEPRAVLKGIEPNGSSRGGAQGAAHSRPLPQAVAGKALRLDPALPWAWLMRHWLRLSGLTVPDQVFGLAWSGAMNARRLRGIVEALPPGVSEIYLHPATRDDWPGHAPGYGYREELAALTDPAVIEACSAHAKLTRFADIAASQRLRL
jgi:hopanoid biosynthesis associated protein HpnK